MRIMAKATRRTKRGLRLTSFSEKKHRNRCTRTNRNRSRNTAECKGEPQVKKALALCAIYALVFTSLPVMQAQNPATFLGIARASDFAYGLGNSSGALVQSGSTGTGSYAITVSFGGTNGACATTISSGIDFCPFAGAILPSITIGSGSSLETVTPSSASCPSGSGTVSNPCSITATFTYSHGAGDVVRSGDAGLLEAMNYQASKGGGLVGVDFRYQQLGGTTAFITGAAVLPTVNIQDTRGGNIVYWAPVGGTTVMTTPTTLTSTTATDSTTPAGTWAASAYAQGISCVDVMGQEGPVSATYAHTPAAGSSSVTFAAPTNCVGAIGYKVYSTLASASYPLAYELPLATQPTAIGGALFSNGSCTLQTVNPSVVACAVTNATYGETGSSATFTAIPVNTSPVAPQTTTISTTSVYVPNPGGRTTYTYAPQLPFPSAQFPAVSQAFPISAAAGTTVPSVLGTVTLPFGYMNVVGRTIEICGKATGVSTATVVSIGFQWDAFGQNSGGKGVVIGALGLTPATAFATTEAVTFCEDFQTTVASASATGGSIGTVGGFINTSGVANAAAGQGASSDPTGAATGSLNLAEDARINITYTHTTGTDGTAPTLYGLTVKAL